LSAALGHFDKRTIELLLSRAERNPPPSHLRDSGIVTLMETHGRERRNRYYNLASYCDLVTRENLEHSTDAYTDIDFTDVGGFARLDPSLFYEDDAQLFECQDRFQGNENTKTGKARKHPYKNPILPDGSVKLGRPRKKPPPDLEDGARESVGKGSSTKSLDGSPRKRRRIDVSGIGKHTKQQLGMNINERHFADEGEASDKVAPKRRRPPKKKPASTAGASAGLSATHEVAERMHLVDSDVPSEGEATIDDVQAAISEGARVMDGQPARKKRGRLPKVKSDHAGVDPVTDVHPRKRQRVDGDEPVSSNHLLDPSFPPEPLADAPEVITISTDVVHHSTLAAQNAASMLAPESSGIRTPSGSNITTADYRTDADNVILHVDAQHLSTVLDPAISVDLQQIETEILERLDNKQLEPSVENPTVSGFLPPRMILRLMVDLPV
jgi:hypothetical protein